MISSLTDGTRAANVLNALYPYIRDEVMGEHPWVFAKKQSILSPNATVPPFGWDYCYDIPSDCLRLLNPDDDSIKWVQMGNQIFSSEPQLNMYYIFRNVDESSWDNRFCEAFAWRLAMEAALSLAQSIPLKQEAEKSYQAALAAARSMNAVIGTRPALEADIWSNARKGFRFNPFTGSQNN